VTESIRVTTGGDAEISSLKRDLASVLKKVPPFTFKEVQQAYSEPMYIGHKTKPKGVLLLSCVSATDQEDADEVLGGSFCHVTWEGARSRIRINSIDGFTPSNTTIFRFTFMVVG
jgi:hypothetical protein